MLIKKLGYCLVPENWQSIAVYPRTHMRGVVTVSGAADQKVWSYVYVYAHNRSPFDQQHQVHHPKYMQTGTRLLSKTGEYIYIYIWFKTWWMGLGHLCWSGAIFLALCALFSVNRAKCIHESKINDQVMLLLLFHLEIIHKSVSLLVKAFNIHTYSLYSDWLFVNFRLCPNSPKSLKKRYF